MATSAEELEARIAALEAENAELRAARGGEAGNGDAGGTRKGRGRGRAALAIVLITLGALLAPVAVISAWARIELVDTDRFVQTFAPLAEDPAVQDFVAAEVSDAIIEQADLPQLTADLFDGIRGLDLPPRAENALGLLEAPAAQGLEALITQTVTRVVQSDAFADTWATALRFTHRQFVAAVQGRAGSALEISGQGELTVQLGPVLDEVKRVLGEQGVGFASLIPEVQLGIVVAQADSLVLVQTVYALAVGVGIWLPWVVLALFAGGVLVARDRRKALVWAGGAFAASMLLLAAGLGVGRLYFLGAVSPSIIPADAAGVLFDGLSEIMRAVSAALALVGVFVALFAWLSGPWRPAVALRGFAESGFAAVRAAAARHGVTTGAFGDALERWIAGVYAVIAVVAASVLLFVRPLTGSLVGWTVFWVLLALLVVQLLRRPAGTPGPSRREEVPAG
ncbi:hypothetical protein ET445_07590 [Agromyces protaetiae]|uniref:Uncharacterized protein n=1 Tax=Agromyces protaetiae TaxID=2509455 RepID=A0A4P6FAJ1_9MICO|nr:hypothetical protein [Agromyces protaetiae]QAY73230.1 hypothetical protein ET445_07590 [Agromyces protaetiae]